MNKEEARTYSREYAREQVRKGKLLVFSQHPLCLCGNVSTVLRGISYKAFTRTQEVRDVLTAEAYTQCRSCYLAARGRIIKNGWDARRKKQQETFREKADKLQELLKQEKYAAISTLVRKDRDTTEGGEGGVV